jgi:putative transposase
MLVYMANNEKTINKIIGESKRFMAYEIVKRLEKLRRFDLLNALGQSVTQHERRKKKKHNVFRPSEDIKEIMTEKFIRQKLNYMHKNPVSGKWKLVENYLDYIHSSARFYELGEEGVFHVYHYQEINNPAEFPPQ